MTENAIFSCNFSCFKRECAPGQSRLNQLDIINKQLFDEAEHDIKNYRDLGQCYLPKPKAEADNIDRDLHNS